MAYFRLLQYLNECRQIATSELAGKTSSTAGTGRQPAMSHQNCLGGRHVSKAHDLGVHNTVYPSALAHAKENWVITDNNIFDTTPAANAPWFE